MSNHWYKGAVVQSLCYQYTAVWQQCMDPIFTSQAETKHLLSALLAIRLDITWKDRITNTAVLKGIQMSTMLSLLRQCLLHWLGHKQWINDESKRTSYTQSYYLSKGQLAILFFAIRMLANCTSGFSKLVKPPVKMPLKAIFSGSWHFRLGCRNKRLPSTFWLHLVWTTVKHGEEGQQT